MSRQPVVERRVRPGHQREERVLVDDPVVKRRRLGEDDEVVAEVGQLVEVGRARRDHLRREHVPGFALELLAHLLRRELVRAHVVDHPHRAVVVGVRCGGEMECDVGRERPVEQSRGQAVMLREREPVPRRVDGDGVARGVLPEGAQQRALDRLRVAAEPGQARRQVVFGARAPAKSEVRAVEAEVLVPGVGEELIVELAPVHGR